MRNPLQILFNFSKVIKSKLGTLKSSLKNKTFNKNIKNRISILQFFVFNRTRIYNPNNPSISFQENSKGQ